MATSELARQWISEQHFDGADQFLEALHPRSASWNSRPDQWVFRGHSDSRWTLLPSAHRAGSWVRFKAGVAYDPLSVDERSRVENERRIARRFQDEADAQGLPLPGPHLDSRMWEQFSRQAWPQPDVIPLLALAQHHGVPTRLLDWTRLGFVAAYFAALPPPEPAEALTVWALNGAFVRSLAHRLGDLHWDIVSAPRASNPNLHAQAGVFTYVYSETRALLTFDAVVTGVATGAIQAKGFDSQASSAPLMRKLTLPRDHADALRVRLHQEGVSALALFPGYYGVVEHLVASAELALPAREF